MNATLNDAIDYIYKLYNNVNNLVAMAIMVENTIVFGNKYRSTYPDIDSELTRAELCFRNGEYTQALTVALATIERDVYKRQGQNYDYTLNGIFFENLKIADPEVYMDAVGDDLGATVGNIINCSYKLMSQIHPEALLILGDTNSCLSAIAAKRLHIPIFHMEAGNRCKRCV